MEAKKGLRIGQFAQRVGVSSDVLRVWERRYGLLPPARSSGNYRLYGEREERLVREVIALRDRGVAIADAVAEAKARWADAGDSPASGGVDSALHAAHLAICALDEETTRATIRGAIATLGVRRALAEVVMPLLQRVGDDWESGRIGIAHEHLASHAVRREVGAVGAVEAPPNAPVVVLACPPGELHDIVLLAVGVLLSHRGISVRFLGANTPYAALHRACEQVRPDLVVLSANRHSVLEARAGAVRAISRSWPIAVGGRGVDAGLALALGATMLPPDLDAAVEVVIELTTPAAELRAAP